MVFLRERIQKSQEEREKREERLLQTHTLQQTGNLLGRMSEHRHTYKLTLLRCSNSLLMVFSSVKFSSHGMKLEQLPLFSRAFSPSPLLSTSPFLDMEEEEEMICFADPSRFITDPDFCYEEFARREEDHFQVFRVQVRTSNLCTYLYIY